MHSVPPPRIPTSYNNAASGPPASHLARLNSNPGNLSPRRKEVSKPCYSKGVYQFYKDFCETGSMPQDESIRSSVASCCLRYGEPEMLAKFLEIGNVKNLDLSHQVIDMKSATSLAEVLKTNTTLLRISLVDSNVEAEGFEAICAAVGENPTLIALDLSHNSINFRQLEAIAKIAANNKTLEVLEFASCGIGAEKLPSLAQALKQNRTLTSVGLAYNALGVESVSTILKIVENNPALKILDLSGNKIGSDGGKSIAGMLKSNSTLIQLDLACNDLGSEGANAIFKAVEDNSTLRRLSLSRNNLDESSARPVANLLKNNTALSALDLSSNYQFFPDSVPDDEAIGLISRALEHNTNVTELRLSTGRSHLGSPESRPASIWNWYHSQCGKEYEQIDKLLQRNRVFDASVEKDAPLASRLFPGRLLSLDEGKLLAGAMIMASPSMAAYEATMVEIQCCVNVLASQT